MIGYELKLTANLEISAYRGYLNAIRTEKKLLDSFRITLHYGNFGVLKFSPSDLKIENIKEVLKTNYYDESFDDEVETISMLIVGSLSLGTDDYETMIVTRKDNRNIVMLSEESYNNLMENIHVMGNKANYDWLMESMEQLKKGQVSEKNIIEVDGDE